MPFILIVFLNSILWGQAPQVGGGVINTVAGTGSPGYSGDGGPADKAALNFIIGAGEEEFGHIALDSNGNLFIADKGNHRIRKLDTNGVITTVAGTGVSGFSGDGGKATAAQLSFPTGITVDKAGNVYFTDQRNDRVRKIDANGNITTVAGSGQEGFGGDGSPATSPSVRMDWPSAVAVDAAGNIYIADQFNDRVRMVNAQTGIITTIAGNGQHANDTAGPDGVPATSIRLGYPAGVLVDGNNLYISDHYNNVVRVMDLQTKVIRRLAGNGEYGIDDPLGDGGPANQAKLGEPVGLALDKDGNLYIADRANSAIRRVAAPVSPTSLISTPVGIGIYGFGGDGLQASDAQFAYPTGVAVNPSGALYIADWHNQRVRRALPGVGIPRPIIFPDGLVNGASFPPPPSRVAAGSVISIFGRRLAPARASASVVPLPQSLLDPKVAVTVTAGGATLFMPLFYVSPDQINAQLPFELPATGAAQVIVRAGDVLSAPLVINLSLSETGVFTYGANHAIAVNQDGRLNTFAEPAARGSTIVVYLTGQGELHPAIPTGQPAPADPLSRTGFPVKATIGGKTARVDFLGATPGFVALSQANIVVPDDAPSGEQPLLINVGGHDSNVTVVNVK
ncbi:MAG: hypothetical protein HY238_08415 [Acidobacteria bacterium]|nr:hypothetical protein [Acidobacteriota bacterium]